MHKSGEASGGKKWGLASGQASGNYDVSKVGGDGDVMLGDSLFFLKHRRLRDGGYIIIQ